MAVILFAVAIFLLWFAGVGLYFFLTKKSKQYCGYELAGLSFLLGIIFIALGSILTSLFLPRGLSRAVLTVICLGLGGYGVRRLLQKPARSKGVFTRRENALTTCGPLPSRIWQILQIVILLAQLGIVGWLGINTTLSWDGLVNWEMKAKVFYEQGGIPKRFLQSEALAWAQVDYPPLMPLNQAWTYGWIGEANQNAGKLFCVIFYLIAVLLLLSTQSFNYAWLMFFIPLTWISDGSATTGHADFPLAVFYLATAKLLSEFAQSGEVGRLKLLGAISLGLVFVKQDSIVLLVTLWSMLPLILFALRLRLAVSYRWLFVLLPASILYSVWKLSMRWLTPYFSKDFHLALPPSWQAFQERLNVVGHFFFWEVLNPLHWGALWIIFFVMLGARIFSTLLAKREANFRQKLFSENLLPAWTLALLVLIPLSGDFLIYLFIGTTADWLTLDYWLTTSAARLILQISLVALLGIQRLATPQAGIDFSTQRDKGSGEQGVSVSESSLPL